MLNWLLPSHIEVPESYFLVLATIMGRPLRLEAADGAAEQRELTLEAICRDGRVDSCC